MTRTDCTAILHVACLSLLALLPLACADEVVAQDVKFAEPAPGADIGPEEVDAAQTHNRIISEEQLSDKIKAVLGLDMIGPEEVGTGGHPFTTKRASAQGGAPAGTPVQLFPYRAAGKLFMKFGTSTFVCTASVVRKRLLVTAAHCVHNYGQKNEGWASAVNYQPARNDGDVPYGTWSASQWWIPTVYWNGTDVCTVPGIVCENDVAVVVLKPLDGKAVGDVTGMFGVSPRDDFGYVTFLEQMAGQITQLGYPAENYSGVRMIRTDSLGYWDDPSNVIIGSGQTGGSSGGPWLMNFGIDDDSFTGAPGTDAKANQVVATTSWGFVSGAVKVQGASRFSKNTAFVAKSNVQALIDAACAANPGAC